MQLQRLVASACDHEVVSDVSISPLSKTTPNATPNANANATPNATPNANANPTATLLVSRCQQMPGGSGQLRACSCAVALCLLGTVGMGNLASICMPMCIGIGMCMCICIGIGIGIGICNGERVAHELHVLDGFDVAVDVGEREKRLPDVPDFDLAVHDQARRHQLEREPTPTPGNLGDGTRSGYGSYGLQTGVRKSDVNGEERGYRGAGATGNGDTQRKKDRQTDRQTDTKRGEEGGGEVGSWTSAFGVWNFGIGHLDWAWHWVLALGICNIA